MDHVFSSYCDFVRVRNWFKRAAHISLFVVFAGVTKWTT
jgi:hypothetical protein